jgi:hypothetical protein
MSTPEPPPYPSGENSDESTSNPSGYPPPPPPPGPPGPAGSQYGTVQPNNRFAIPALILGILSITGLCCYGVGGPILGIPAAILGHIGKREIRESGGAQGGQGMAQAGFITGIVGSVLGALGFVVIVLFIILGFAVDPGSFE